MPSEGSDTSASIESPPDTSKKQRKKPVHKLLHFQRTKRVEKWELSEGLIVGLTTLVIVVFFMVYIWHVPNPLVFKPRALYGKLIPYKKEGNLFVYPNFLSEINDDTKNNSFLISLPPEDLKNATDQLKNLLEDYPKYSSESYTQCWVDYATYSKPCFFDKQWVQKKKCLESESFGYTEQNGFFNPCIFLRFQNTSHWGPIPLSEKMSIPLNAKGLQYFDTSFMEVYCFLYEGNKTDLEKIEIFPSKGFAIPFFPASAYKPEKYMPPMIAISISKLKRSKTITIKCEILAENTLSLHNEGTFMVKFIAGYRNKQ